MATVPVVATVSELRAIVGRWRDGGETVALLPTMGALHDGHLALGRTGKSRCDRLITSIFVNPTQFAPQEDFSTYPRTFDDDLAQLRGIGCDLVWAPTAEVMYPPGFATMITPAGAAEGLESDYRPHFFQGVATVCCKLFTQTRPDIALFGEKDYQQLCVIRQIVRDLDLALAIVGCETVREPDGLAMSSRNAYLDGNQRKVATAVYATLRRIADDLGAGADPDQACRQAEAALLGAGFDKVDYIAVRNGEDLQPFDPAANKPGRILVAAWLGNTRLIDNIAC